MGQPELFEDSRPKTQKDAADFYRVSPVRPGIPGMRRPADFFELSADAYYAALHAWMSELPIEAEITRFVKKVSSAGDRTAAARAASDRGDPDVLTVLNAAYKVLGEIHRMTGLLRFNPDPQGVYTARCEPDYFILPGLAEHFTLRFGETPWAIIDLKRSLCLCRQKHGQARLGPVSTASAEGKAEDTWEDLWRLYHRSINNEARNNPGLQRQFMPERYHKYLPEMNND